MIKDYKNKKVLILGLGLNEGGVGAARFFAKAGAKVRVTDLKDKKTLKPSLEKLKEYKNIEYVLGTHKKEDIAWADLIIKNQAIISDNEFIAYAKSKNKQVETDIGIFLKFINPKQIIGITGTKGKTTTASFIYEAIKYKYPNTLLAGNIGRSVLDIVELITPNSIVILELSSFQLQTFDEKKVSPHIAVITNIYPDHLNYHKDMHEYIGFKKVIGKYQTADDLIFINADDKTLNTKKFLNGFSGQINYFSPKDLPKDFKLKLPGQHNRSNYAAALKVAKIFSISEEEALANMNKFEGAQFRLQTVYFQNGVRIINDSAATNPDATISALKTYNNALLICGGMDKGLDFTNLAHLIERSAKSVYFIEGDATYKLKEKIKHKNILRSTYNDLVKLLQDVKTEVKKGTIILFSPGATSFNLFQNEFDRGRQFNQAVESVFK